jgi:hypothetical protein
MMARRLVPIVFVLTLLIPGAAAYADSTPAGQGNSEHDPDDHGAPYFKNLKARLDAYSERQLNEMDKYQNRTVL